MADLPANSIELEANAHPDDDDTPLSGGVVITPLLN